MFALMVYRPKTGARCACRPGMERNNCPTCEGTGWVIDFKAIHAARAAEDAAVIRAGRLPPSWGINPANRGG